MKNKKTSDMNFHKKMGDNANRSGQNRHTFPKGEILMKEH